MKKSRYEPSKRELFRMIERHIAKGDLDMAWQQVRVLRRRAARKAPRRAA